MTILSQYFKKLNRIKHHSWMDGSKGKDIHVYYLPAFMTTKEHCRIAKSFAKMI